MTAATTLTDATDTANRARETAALIRVAVLDDHAAVRAGLEAILRSAPGMVSVGSARGEAELDWLLRRTDPSVLVLDVEHPGLNGLALSLRLKRRSARPRIVIRLTATPSPAESPTPRDETRSPCP